jgi:16S rRNA (guanine966-N2)-methyltransferase
MDRVKAAIFSMLGEKVIEARVLDLFAGAGGLGIEALSRGAASAVFVESNRQAANAIERNLATAGLQARVRATDVFAFLQHLTGTFDIIFADPPYEPRADGQRFTELLLNNGAIPQLLAAGGVLVLEKRPDERRPEHSNWKLLRARKYGATEVLLLAHAR